MRRKSFHIRRPTSQKAIPDEIRSEKSLSEWLLNHLPSTFAVLFCVEHFRDLKSNGRTIENPKKREEASLESRENEKWEGTMNHRRWFGTKHDCSSFYINRKTIKCLHNIWRFELRFDVVLWQLKSQLCLTFLLVRLSKTIWDFETYRVNASWILQAFMLHQAKLFLHILTEHRQLQKLSPMNQ